MKMETKVIAKVEDTNIEFDVCEELYEMWTGHELDDRIIAVEFWQNSISNLIDDMKDDDEFDVNDKWTNSILTLFAEVNKLDGDVMLAF